MITMAANYRHATLKAEELLNDNLVFSPPVDPYTLAENVGLYVSESPFPDHLADYSGYINIDKRTIVVNSRDSANRRKFTVAHEIGHWMLHRDDVIMNPDLGILPRKPLGQRDPDDKEREANCFASNLLVPRKMLRKYKTEDVNLLADIFAVSADVINYSLRDLNY